MSTVNVPENVASIAKTLKKEMKLGSNGVVELTEGAIEKTLEESGIDMKTVQVVHNHRDDVLAGMSLALGEIGIDAMKKDKKLGQVSVEAKLHKDVMGSTFSRERAYPNGNGGMSTSYGSMSAKYTANGAVARGGLKKVKSHLSEMAKEVLSK